MFGGIGNGGVSCHRILGLRVCLGLLVFCWYVRVRGGYVGNGNISAPTNPPSPIPVFYPTGSTALPSAPPPRLLFRHLLIPHLEPKPQHCHRSKTITFTRVNIRVPNRSNVPSSNESRSVPTGLSRSGSNFYVQRQRLIKHPNFLIRPILHVVFRQFKVEAPDHLCHDQVHFSPRQSVHELLAYKLRRDKNLYSRFTQTGTRAHHERLIHRFSVRIKSRLGFLEPPLWVKNQGVHKIHW